MKFSRGRFIGLLAASSALSLAAVMPARAAATAPPPPQVPVPPAGTGALMGMATELGATDSGMPPGVVNGPCTPSAQHPYPVVLVHGTFANAAFSWQTLAPMLSNAGYCVFALNYGATTWTTFSNGHVFGVDFVENSAVQLENFIQGTVLPNTFAADGSHPTQVDIVGHSQGGMMPRYLINSTTNSQYPGLGDSTQVHTLVGLAPSNQGTTGGGLVTLSETLASFGGNPNAPYDFASSGGCGACGEQESGSPFLRALNGQADASGVNHYVIESTYDEVVTPYTNAFLPATENVQNITLQAQCPTDATEHLGIIYDSVALQDVMAALANNTTTTMPLPQPTCPAAVLPIISG